MSDEYSFLQEKIKDEAGSPKTIKKRIMRMILFGFIFGVVSCFTFFVSKPIVLSVLGQDKEEVTIPEDEDVTEQKEKEEEQVEERAEEYAKEQRQMKMLKTLQNKAKQAVPSMVHIFGQKKIEKNTEIRMSSGVIIADNGSEILVLSQTLSDKELKNIRIKFVDGKEYPAKVKIKDNNCGIAIYSVEKEALKDTTLRQMKIEPLGNSFIVESGNPVILLGKTDNNTMMVSYGFVVSSEEKLEISDGYIELLRVDAAGSVYKNGIVLNQDGELIGLVNDDASDNEALVTAYSISDIKKEVGYMSNEKSVPYIGIKGVPIPKELEDEDLTQGIYMREVDTDSPAMSAGIQPGDVITHIDDIEIADMKKYRATLLKYSVKDEITMTGFRKGADENYVEMEFSVVIGKK